MTEFEQHERIRRLRRFATNVLRHVAIIVGVGVPLVTGIPEALAHPYLPDPNGGPAYRQSYTQGSSAIANYITTMHRQTGLSTIYILGSMEHAASICHSLLAATAANGNAPSDNRGFLQGCGNTELDNCMSGDDQEWLCRDPQ